MGTGQQNHSQLHVRLVKKLYLRTCSTCSRGSVHSLYQPRNKHITCDNLQMMFWLILNQYSKVTSAKIRDYIHQDYIRIVFMHLHPTFFERTMLLR